MKQIRKVFVDVEQSRAYGRGLLRGISKYARIHGPWMFLKKPERFFGGSGFSPLKRETVEGAIIRESTKAEIEKVVKLEIPVIVSNHRTANSSLPSIVADDVMIGQIGATHFLNRGFRHFAFCSAGETFWSDLRCNSFAETVAKANYQTHVYKIPKRCEDKFWDREQHILAAWVTSLPKPIALMTSTDDRAFELMEICDIVGIKVPEDVAILGVDNDDLVCEMTSIPISSVALGLEQAGYEAAALLDKLMAGTVPKRQEIVVKPTHIQERRSTDILAVEDPIVAKAMQFIQSRGKEPLQISDISKHVAISQRRLFDLFQEAIGRSVFDEMTRVRINNIIWMLETTNLSIKEIAEIMGMSDGKHFSRYFQRHKGMTPIAWRKQQAMVKQM